MPNTNKQKHIVLGSFALSPVFAIVNYLWLAMSDMGIAAALGAFRKLPPGDCGQWTEIGAISWTFSCLLGVVWSIFPPLALLAVLYAGFVSALLCFNLSAEGEAPFGKGKWISWSVVLFWLVRVPVPLDYSLFYWVAVKY